ncbi:MAG: NADP-dependent oxidoreductase [Sphingomonadales bacterium]|nr:NADP-dependent oxidoreductase [Sphingomonadales bacterium]
MTINRRFLLVRRPDGSPAAEDFRLDPRALPELDEGQFLIRNHYASLDPAIRGWLDDKPSYMPPIALGDPVRASTIGVVADSRNPANYLSLFGAVGLTAYFGFIDVCEPKAGDTVLVSGAAGAVGSLVGQIAKIKGCRAIGIAGGAAKCARLTERYGFDAAIDYRGKDVAALDAAIRAVAPDGVDIIFENVGGDILDAGLLNLRHGARVGLCGLISEYNAPAPVGIRNLWRLIVNRASIRGLLVADYIPRFTEGAAAMGQWLREGRLVFDEHIDEGIENALPAFMRLFDGSNDGKMILKLAPDEQGL